KSGNIRVNLNLSAGVGEVSASSMADLMNTKQYLEMRKEAYSNESLPIPTTPAFDNYDLTFWDPNRDVDWQEALIGGTAQYQNAQASIIGGTESLNYSVSTNYRRQTTVFPHDFSNKK